MPESNSARERLDAAVEAKGLSSFPSLKRVILRSRFVAILFTLALPVLVLRAFEREFDAEILVTTAIDAALVIGVWWLSVSLVKCARKQQWERLSRMLATGAQVILVSAVLGGLGALAGILSSQINALVLGAGGAAVALVWRNDYLRARRDVLAMMAERGLEPTPVDPGQSQIARRKLQRWTAAAVVSVAVVAGVSWLAVEVIRGRNVAQEQKHAVDEGAWAERVDEAGVLTLRGHEGDVLSVAYSPNGRTLASASEDGTVRLWEVTTFRTIATLSGHEQPVATIAFSPDGSTLASGSKDNTVRIWDVASGKTTTTLKGHNSAVSSVAYSPNGRTLASASEDGTVRLWEVASGKTIGTLSGHGLWVFSVAFSPDGNTIASGAIEDRSVRLWNVASGQAIATLSGHNPTVHSVAFSPDGRTLAAGSSNTILLWDVAAGKTIATFSGHESSIRMALSPNGRTLASASEDGTVRVWDIGSGKALGILSGHKGIVTSIAFSPDGRTLASGSSDQTVRLWPLPPEK